MEREHPLRAYRRDKKVTLQSLANQVGVTKGFLSKIETGRQLPSFRLAERVSAATDGALTLNDFLLSPKRNRRESDDTRCRLGPSRSDVTP